MAKLTQSFQAETKELLNLMIHSLYSQREIFLRELISNASDALEKLKFSALTQPELLKDQGVEALEIRLQADSAKKTLSISDNGIGMSYDEVVQNLGTIAHSGTKAFLKRSQEAKNHPELIGQFGVGFYSAFMVADRVSVCGPKKQARPMVCFGSQTLEARTPLRSFLAQTAEAQRLLCT